MLSTWSAKPLSYEHVMKDLGFQESIEILISTLCNLFTMKSYQAGRDAILDTGCNLTLGSKF